jgi:hypothetical protein
MNVNQIIEGLDKLSKRDFVRLFLAVEDKYADMKSENGPLLRTTLWAVKNPEKARECLNKSREKVRQQRLMAEK